MFQNGFLFEEIHFLKRILVHLIHLASWYILGVKLVLTLVIGAGAVLLYGTLAHRENGAR